MTSMAEYALSMREEAGGSLSGESQHGVAS
jgi:hypothetical protein